MKRRIARKVCRIHFDDRFPLIRHKYTTVREAIRIGRRNWLSDKRFPYILSDSEMEERGEIVMSLFASLAESLGCELPPELSEKAFSWEGGC